MDGKYSGVYTKEFAFITEFRRTDGQTLLIKSTYSQPEIIASRALNGSFVEAGVCDYEAG